MADLNVSIDLTELIEDAVAALIVILTSLGKDVDMDALIERSRLRAIAIMQERKAQIGKEDAKFPDED